MSIAAFVRPHLRIQVGRNANEKNICENPMQGVKRSRQGRVISLTGIGLLLRSFLGRNVLNPSLTGEQYPTECGEYFAVILTAGASVETKCERVKTFPFVAAAAAQLSGRKVRKVCWGESSRVGR